MEFNLLKKSEGNQEILIIFTYSDIKNFYSYRRSCHNGEKDYGRCISVILMT